MRSSAGVVLAALLAGCAAPSPEEPLLWSDALVRSLERERGPVVEVARFSRARPGAVGAPWEPYFIVRDNHPTAYRVVEREWRWQVPAREPALSQAARVSAMARVSIAFHSW